MDSTNNVILTSPAKTEINGPSIYAGAHDNNLNTDPVLQLVKNDGTPLQDKNNIDISMENAIYNLMCPWDYLINFSSVSINPKISLKSSTACNRQLKSLVNHFELLLSQFKALLETSCSFESEKANLEGTKEVDSEEFISLSENLATILGHHTDSDNRLVIKDVNKLRDEYQRTSKVLNSVIEFVTYRDLTETFCVNDEDELRLTNEKHQFMDTESGDEENSIQPLIKDEKTNISLETKEKKPPSRIQNSAATKTEISLQKKIRPYEPLGYKSEFCITEEAYNEVLNNGSPYKCKLCQRLFKDRRNFEHHLNGRCIGVPSKGMEWEPKWKKEDGRLHCLFDGCTETYTHKQSLYKHHQRTHIKDTTNLPFKCDQCDKSFIIKSILSIHIQEMHKEKVRKCCEICGASVRSNTDLKLHMRRRHTGEMPFKCEYCDFRGVNISSVKRHTRLKHETHLLTFHCCDICGKQFKTKANLKEHIPTHSDKRTFLCKICGKCLKNDCSYRRHMVCVHGIKFTCELCGKDYSAIIGLKVHQRNVHGINS